MGPMIPGLRGDEVREDTGAAAEPVALRPGEPSRNGHRAEVRAYFDGHVQEWDRDRYRDSAYIGRGRFAGSLLRALRREGRVLDVGCGTGRQALDAARAGHTVVAMDLSYAMARATRDRLRVAAPDAAALVVVADATALPFREASFDATIALGLIGFVEDREALLDQLTGSLRAGGHLVCDVGVPEDRVLLNRLNRRLDALLGRLAARSARGAVPAVPPGFYASHFTKCSPEQLRSSMRSRGLAVRAEGGAGFGEVRVRGRPVLPWRVTMLLTRLLNALSRRLGPGLLARRAMIYLVAARRSGPESAARRAPAAPAP